MKFLRLFISTVLAVAVLLISSNAFDGQRQMIPAEDNIDLFSDDQPSANTDEKEEQARIKAEEEQRKKAEEEQRKKAEEEKKKEEQRRKAEEEKKKKEAEELRKKQEEASRKEKEKYAVDADWFDDAVFVGDSLTVMLSIYAEAGEVGDADFVCASSLGYNNALWDLKQPGNVHPLYKGKKCTAFDGVKQTGRKKVIIMLGMNDIGVYGVDGAIDGMKEFTERMLKKNPGVTLYFQSVTPMLKNKQRSDLNNKNIPEFDNKLKAFCEENGYKYVDLIPAVSDGEGNLVYENCGDPDEMGLHPSMTGCAKWVDCLKIFIGKDEEKNKKAQSSESQDSTQQTSGEESTTEEASPDNAA